jgi:MFS family permease
VWSGVAVCGAPSLERELGLSHTAYVVFVFALPLVVAAGLEAAVAVVSDRVERRWLVAAGQAGLAAALLFVAWTDGPWGLAAGLAVAGATSGVACAAAQALLVSAEKGGTDRAMARWALFAAVGDLLAPLVTAGAIALGFSYRGALVAVAAVAAVQAVGTALARDRAHVAEGEDDEVAAEPLRAALGRAARNGKVWLWLFAAASCTLLDELVVALGSLRLSRDLGASDALAAGGAVAFSGGAVIGAALTDRAVSRFGRRAVLVWSSVLCGAAIGAALLACSPGFACATLFAIGVTCAPHHGLALARAYDEMPGRPGTVQALGQLFVAVDVVAPLALGAVADRFGLTAAIACLALQPAVILGCAATMRAAAP